MNFKEIIVSASLIGMSLALPATSFAHAVVKPATAAVGSYTDFSLGVPSEKEASTVSVKLFIPEGINSVSPIVKPGWNVEIINSDKTGEPDDDGMVTPVPAAILWTGGSVPAHQKDYFMFSTQVPNKETELDWKIEQTYSDGTVVSWNLAPGEQPKDEKGNPDFSKSGPFSKTKVIDDLSNDTKVASSATVGDNKSNLPLILSAIAVVLSGLSLGMNLRKK